MARYLNEGKTRTSLEIIGNEVILLDQRSPQSAAPGNEATDLEDVPF